jgi:hypothetical protein
MLRTLQSRPARSTFLGVPDISHLVPSLTSLSFASFNEPDNVGQANMTPQAAAAAWKKYMQPFAGKAKLVSPTITNAGPPNGEAWINSFLKECSGCKIDAIAIHIYTSPSSAPYFKTYISDGACGGTSA